MSTAELEIIAKHNERMTEAACSALTKLMSIPSNKRTRWQQETVKYYKNARSAFKWSTAIAKAIVQRETHGSGSKRMDDGQNTVRGRTKSNSDIS